MWYFVYKWKHWQHSFAHFKVIHYIKRQQYMNESRGGGWIFNNILHTVKIESQMIRINLTDKIQTASFSH